MSMICCILPFRLIIFLVRILHAIGHQPIAVKAMIANFYHPVSCRYPRCMLPDDHGCCSEHGRPDDPDNISLFFYYLHDIP